MESAIYWSKIIMWLWSFVFDHIIMCWIKLSFRINENVWIAMEVEQSSWTRSNIEQFPVCGWSWNCIKKWISFLLTLRLFFFIIKTRGNSHLISTQNRTILFDYYSLSSIMIYSNIKMNISTLLCRTDHIVVIICTYICAAQHVPIPMSSSIQSVC